MAQVFKTTFQLRRGLLEVWEKNNPILAKGEPSFVLDKNLLKIGDGVTPWKELEYIGLNQEDLAKAIEDYFKENPGGGTGVDGRGIVSITRTKGDGAPGTIDTYTITYTDLTTSTFTVYNGKDGQSGSDGRGIMSIMPPSGGGVPGTYDIYTINYTDKTTSTFKVYNGNDGRGIISIDKIGGNGGPGTQDTYQINYSDGSNFVFQIYNGKDGNVNADWNATSGDAQILNKPTLGSMAAKSSVAKSDLASGVQTSLSKADSALQPGDISAWAKASTKPTYTASEVGAIPAPTDVKVGQYFKVSSVANGKITGIEAVDPWILSDEVTGTKYKLSVVKGKLTMTESEV